MHDNDDGRIDTVSWVTGMACGL